MSDLSIGELLDLRKKNKNFLTKENLEIISFTFLLTFFVMVYLIWPLLGFFIPQKIDAELKNLFLYPIFILMLISCYYVGIIISKYEFHFSFKGFNLKSASNYNYSNFVKLFDFQGVLRNNYDSRKKKCLYLNYSSEGLITKQGFDNFELSFDAEMFNKGFGIILCAKNLENYFMFRVHFDKNKEGERDKYYLYIVPHIRKDGIWEIQKIYDEKKEFGGENVILNFVITKEDKLISLFIKEENKLVKKFEYLLPDYFPLIKFTNDSDDDEKGLFNNIIPRLEFPIFGKIGFRAYGQKEKAVIYNFKIKNLVLK